jgi:hypothetical protein
MIKKLIHTPVLLAGLTWLLASNANSQEWNYFGDCFSDDVILAQNGKWFTPCMNRGGCERKWNFGGTYDKLSDGVIQIYWTDENGIRHSATMTHRRLGKAKCKR